jgi:hypothetical protein
MRHNPRLALDCSTICKLHFNRERLAASEAERCTKLERRLGVSRS